MSTAFRIAFALACACAGAGAGAGASERSSAGPAPAQRAGEVCLARDALAPLLASDGLFLGELHGTAEIPALVECLARRLADELAGQRTLHVALELPAAAVTGNDAFWRPRLQDGRYSKAMWQLVHQLQALQAQDRITVTGFVPDDAPADAASYEEALARELDRIPASTFLLALAGNSHVRRTQQVGAAGAASTVSAGSLIQRRMRHVLIEHRLPSTAWVCMPDCGPHALKSAPDMQQRLPGWLPSDVEGFDQMLLLERLAASPPAFPSPQALPHAP